MPLILLEKECGVKCKSRKHVQEIISIIIRGSLREFQAFSNLCYNWHRLTDVFGRSALHIAASCGKTDIVEWLLEEKKVDLTPKDLESGYTALHRALFYGQLSCARLLVQYNCDVQVRDVEGLSPLDIVMLDKPPHVTYSLKEPNEVYAWGENHNSTLGHSSPHKRITPEPVDMFKKAEISIKQIVLCKYHSVFLSQSGQVYTCGHGHGGRLGHNDQQTILVPRLLDSVKEHTCLEIAAACDHTVLRMAGGLVYTFGLNACHQLGQTPYVESSPEPKQMNLKPLKGKSISGVCVGRFHSVVWTPDSVFTVGLNAGHLGHQRGDKHQTTLRQVSYLRHTDIGISRVACSDGATVCLTTKGDVYVLHEYQCKKIASKWQEIEQVLVTGGILDHTIGHELLTENGGEGLKILMKNESGQLFLWRSSSPNLKRCQFGLKRQLWVSDVAMSSSSLVLSTNRGEAFMGYIPTKKLGAVPRDTDSKHSKDYPKDSGDGFSQPRLLDLLLKDEVEDISLRRLPFVHRAVLVSADKKGRNFAVLQALPNGCLSELPSVNSSDINEQFGRLCREADLQDNIHDAVIQVGNKTWPVHQYIIAYRSDHFRNMVAASTATKGETLVLKVDHISTDIMDQLINFIYTDMCDYLQLGHRVQSQPLTKDERDTHKSEPVGDDVDVIITKGLSAFQIQQQRQNNKGGRREGNKLGQGEVKDESKLSRNPVKMLQDAARRFGVKGLSKRLDAVKCSGDVIISQGKNLTKPKIKFDRSKLPELYDVTISSDDGEEIQCHKCILVPRLEYFYSMLSTGWVETFNTTTLTLPVSGKVLEILIDFLYSDDSPLFRDCANEELLCNVLVVADQLLATRLKEMCEVALTNNITFKNVGEFLEFSTVYNAHQLKAACQQFVCLNLSAVLEGRYLDVLSQETMEELTAHYKSVIPNMAYRVMTPDTNGPSQAYLDDLVSEFDSFEGDSLVHQADPGSAKKSKQVKKKSKARKSSSDDFEKPPLAVAAPLMILRKVDRAASQSSDVSLRSEEDVVAVVEELKKQAEEDEKNLLAAVARSKERMKWKPLELAIDKVTPRPSAPTQPEDVPQWTSNYKTLSRPNQQTGCENGTVSTSGATFPTSGSAVPDRSATSPVSPSLMATSPTSLRDIMLQESKSAEKSRSSFSNRISWKDVKKQQTKEKQQKPVSSEPTEKSVVNPSPKTATNPWASVGGAVKSLRDLMIQEEKIVSAPVAIPASSGGNPRKPAVSSSVSSSLGSYGKSPPVSLASWGLSKSSGGAATGAAANTSSLSPGSAGAENPWQRRTVVASSPPARAVPAAVNFSAILQDEKEKSETLVRTTQKPLSLIQLEEQAMNELLSHYKADKDHDRYITVERVSKAMAAPLWHRDPKPSGISFL